MSNSRWVCWFLGHAWSKYNGWYNERVADGAVCLRCDKKYRKVNYNGKQG